MNHAVSRDLNQYYCTCISDICRYEYFGFDKNQIKSIKPVFHEWIPNRSAFVVGEGLAVASESQAWMTDFLSHPACHSGTSSISNLGTKPAERRPGAEILDYCFDGLIYA